MTIQISNDHQKILRLIAKSYQEPDESDYEVILYDDLKDELGNTKLKIVYEELHDLFFSLMIKSNLGTH